MHLGNRLGEGGATAMKRNVMSYKISKWFFYMSG